MKNIFSYQFGAIFSGKEIKEYLLYRKSKGYSLSGLKQYLNCKDDVLYRYVWIQGSAVGTCKRGFEKLQS